MSSNIGIALLVVGISASAVAMTKVIRSTYSNSASSSHENVVLISHGSKRELRTALRSQGIEVGSSDMEYLTHGPGGCVIHVVGTPPEEQLSTLVARCTKR